MSFTAGHSSLAGATWTPDGGGTTVLAIRGHSWEEQVAGLLTTHTQSGGKAARIAGVLDGQGNVTADVDAALLPPGFSLKAGQKGVMTFGVGSASPFSVHGMILKVHYQTAVEGKVEYNFDVAMDSTTGAYVYPS